MADDHATAVRATFDTFRESEISDLLPISKGIQNYLKLNTGDLNESRHSALIAQLINAVLVLEARVTDLEAKAR